MSVNKRSNDDFTRIEGRDLVMERFFLAPQELVYSSFTEPDHLRNWWGPFGWTTTNYQMDVRPGGIWHYCMRSDDGEEAWGKAVYREVDPFSRLVYLDSFSDENGNDAEGFPQMLTTIEFIKDGNGTRIVNRTQFDSEEDLKKITDMEAIEGMTQTFDRLEGYLSNQS